ncbi:glycosyltransferase family 4 protein [Streptomyces sp. NPDC001339]|uniref:glycosyltransferase family 4 protein n=1 Tax=Streptomyces sp. NPDC001339 TaxID=3364563 RepID=UPI0036CEDB6C
MRVVALVHWYVPFHNAGSETMLHTLLRALVDAGHEAHVVTTSQEEGEAEYVHQGVTVHRAGSLGTVPELLGSLAPGVLVTHHQETPHATQYGRTRGVPVVQIIHNEMHHTRVWLHKRPALAVFNTLWIERELARYNVPGIVVHPPIHAAEHATAPGELVTLVNLNAHKGGKILYELAERMPDIKFAGVIGGHGEQVIRRDVPNVEIIPHTPDMRGNVWSRTRVLLMPSVYESYGMAAIEAMCSGIPVIANPTPGLVESVSWAGTFADRANLDAWVSAIRSLTLRDRWAAASAAARERVAELDPRPELARWVSAVERLEVEGRGHGVRNRR